ncbi:MAG: hypothetical protein HY553_02050 [Elusimicrobia bacterium]|nr:hypothetical protein [Elusimicrobiota bacterium]
MTIQVRAAAQARRPPALQWWLAALGALAAGYWAGELAARPVPAPAALAAAPTERPAWMRPAENRPNDLPPWLKRAR